MMIIDQIGDWNPQLFREWKGRLKGRNLAIASTFSLLSQVILWMALQSQFPRPISPDDSPNWFPNSRYCTGSASSGGKHQCLPDGLGYWQIDWQDFGLDLVRWSSVIMIVTLIIGGVYLLINDLANEQKRGTLNFIRLTPQSSESILLGKILGVPALVYFAVALVLPLQIGSAIVAGVSIDTLVRFYILALAGCGLFYTTALLLGFLGGTAGLGCLVTGLFSYPYILLLVLMFPQNGERYWRDFQWFSLNLGENPNLLQLFVLGNFILWTFWLWQVVNRRFRNPSATILSKRQSYSVMACWQGLLIGLTFNNQSSDFLGVIVAFSILNLIAFLILIAALSQQRQTLQNWARYKHLAKQIEGQRYSALQEWVFGEKSPALVAVAINLAITAIIWLPMLLIVPFNHKELVIISLFSSANLIWIYGAIAQFMLFLKNSKRIGFAVATVASALVLPPILLTFIPGNIAQNSGLWLFSVFGFGVFNAESTALSISSILLSFLGQICTMGAVSWQLNRVLRKAGNSETKMLLQERRS